jgi:tetratricopeptide (TPR) repeat protein
VDRINGKGNADRASALIEYARDQVAPAKKPGRADGLPFFAKDTVPGYELREFISPGGQGVVYRAVQKSTEKHVAIKFMALPLSGGLDNSRFRREVKALARIDNPNIVSIRDSGVVGAFCYVVMDYVPGESLAARVDDKLGVKDALRLMRRIAQAVHAAHLHGIIHRDLKPSNIRVTPDGEPRVLDFGLARIVADDAGVPANPSVVTTTGQFVGSLPWASPEQVSGDAQAVDLRSDVYSLGVILFQLLTGRFPYPVTGSMKTVMRNIQETAPTKPSTLRPEVDDDVETIVLKCLQKDPARRYQSAGDLADDIENYLGGRPIGAKRDSTFYVMSKAVRRHKALAVAAAVLLAVTVVYAATTTVLLRRATLAERAQTVERERAEQSRDEAEQVTRFLENMILSVNPENRGKDVTVRELLDRSAGDIASRFSDHPLVEARLKRAIGGTYFALGLYDDAQSHLADAGVIFHRILGERDPRTLEARNAYAGSLLKTGKYSESEASQRVTLELRRRILGEEHQDTLATMSDLANALYGQGRYEEAADFYRKILEVQVRRYGEKDKTTLAMMVNMGGILATQERLAEAEAVIRRMLSLCDGVLSEDHPTRLTAMNNLADILADAGHFAEAESIARRTLEIRRRVLGIEHDSTLGTMFELANAVSQQGRFAEADELASEALAVWDAKGTNTNGDRWLTLGIRGRCLAGLGRFGDAEPLLVEAYEHIQNKGDVTPGRRHRILQDLVALYESWDAAAPGKGHADAAAKYRQLLGLLETRSENAPNEE